MAEHADTAAVVPGDDEVAATAADDDAAVAGDADTPDGEAESDDPANEASADEAPDPADGAEEDQPAAQARRPIRQGLIAGLLIVAALSGLVGWLSYQAYQSHQAEQQRRLFLQTGRQAAINLTTISYTSADTDVARILDSATGALYDDFQKRAQPFIDVVKKAQSASVGTVAEAGLESVSGNEAQVLVAVQVKTSIAGAEPPPRGWRMRINVQMAGKDAKVSNVAFVP